MLNILLISNQDTIIEKWRPLLALDYKISVSNELNLDTCGNFEIVILDASFIDNQAFDISTIKQYPTKFLIIGNLWPEEHQVSVLVAGAVGYCDSTTSASVILKAIESILQGDIWIQRHLITKVISSLVKITADHSHQPAPELNTIKLACLSSRELDVALLIRKGICNKDIASKLFISERTVKAHLTSIFAKLNVTNRLHLGVLLKEFDE